MSDVLVDSSVWVDFFRGEKRAVARVDSLLEQDRVAISGPILAEVVSGAPTVASFQQLRTRLSALNALADPPDLWERVGDLRFQLARQGNQAHLIDLVVAVTAHAHGHALLTRDRDFTAIAAAITLDLEVF